MRIWSIHPKYLDSKRLTAQWREALLCRQVLEGNTKGYKHHPQFIRIQNHSQPHFFINYYLFTIWEEATRRGYNYNKEKLVTELTKKYVDPFIPMEVTGGQLEYEFYHMQLKTGEFSEQWTRNNDILSVEGIVPNRLFVVVPGPIESFEKPKEETLNSYTLKT